jgi:hypothetical protein
MTHRFAPGAAIRRAHAKQQSDGAVRKILFMLEPSEITWPLARQRVTVVDYPDGRVAIRHQGRDLPYRTFDKLQKVNQAAVVENKRLGEVLAYIAEQQQLRDQGRSQKAPRRGGQADRHISSGRASLRNPGQFRAARPTRQPSWVTFLLCCPGAISTLHWHPLARVAATANTTTATTTIADAQAP